MAVTLTVVAVSEFTVKMACPMLFVVTLAALKVPALVVKLTAKFATG